MLGGSYTDGDVSRKRLVEFNGPGTWRCGRCQALPRLSVARAQVPLVDEEEALINRGGPFDAVPSGLEFA